MTTKHTDDLKELEAKLNRTTILMRRYPEITMAVGFAFWVGVGAHMLFGALTKADPKCEEQPQLRVRGVEKSLELFEPSAKK